MSPKFVYFLAISVGSVIGSYVPVLFGAGLFSPWSIISSAVFALLALFLAYKVLNS